ncbi:M20 aminoacylase family protein [Bordetella avium]|uniref:M20 aminoacylase family protein n=1 Tax=Bordetella avium TaxID=521 RepID=UPI000E0B3478|nr:M20 aminoacylase family protein [Bordetella avium]RIQ13780.1 amidohydrolase [Bordetella avium]RIQ39476.1 amidohydrolase [Bordetella avium]RIQ44275.1 amidohydrolase [Bordetella avium]RIQ45507.1 amidohydrolase [Bordetella avium]RIQ51314.1 amidohydrolase [Bordetella avium]
MSIDTRAADVRPDPIEGLSALRRQLHARPELRFEEHLTADAIAQALESYGYAVERGIAETGIVATLPGKNPGRAIMLRADMDALPIQEANDFEHASRHQGRMHACGHDGHIVMLLGAARALKRLPQLPGTVHFVFQPGEEGGAGAKRMIDEGLFTRFPTDAVFGMHNWPALAVGSAGIRPGPIMAAGLRFRILVLGKGAHAAQPHLGRDPIPLACTLVLELQTLAARHKNPIEPAVISVCMLNAGHTDNVIPESVEIRGTARALSTDVLEMLQERMRNICKGLALAQNTSITLECFQFYPATVNTAAETQLCAKVLQDSFGIDKVDVNTPPNMTSEDFGFMLQEKPGAYVLIGNGAPDGQSPPLHHPHYDFNDSAIAHGVQYWVNLAQAYFRPVQGLKPSGESG